ncbi:MAG: hypothetical protein ABI196_18235 [Bradyrhizobium sp.]
MRAFLIAIALLIVGVGASAQSANEGLEGLESCFQAARLSDAICMNLTNSPVQQLDCFQKARAAQLECLQHVPSGTSAKSAVPEKPTGTISSETPAGKIQPEMPRVVSPASSTGTASTERPAESVSPGMSGGKVSPQMPAGNITANEPTGTVSPRPPPAMVPSQMPAAVSRERHPRAVSPDMPPRTFDIPAKPPVTNWVVSETTSPIDYSPLVTAAIHATSSEKDAPNTFAIRCRESHIELMLRTEGSWRLSRGSEIQVDYQVNDQSVVRQQWASADGKTAIYQDDAAGLVRSLPEGARLKINVFDGSGPGHDATFQLTGMGAIWKKIAAACK